MKKVGFILSLLLVCVLACSCTSETSKPEKNESDSAVVNSEVNLLDVRDDILATLEIEDYMPIETQALKSLYGIEEESVKQSAVFVTMSGTFPHEVIMIEAKDSSGVALIKEALEKKLDEVLIQSKSYDAENYALAQQCKVYENGNFVMLFLSPNHSEMKSIAEKYI